ncbi:MAG: hypothetical protein RIF32_12850 [Leptospirales bacterium]
MIGTRGPAQGAFARLPFHFMRRDRAAAPVPAVLLFFLLSNSIAGCSGRPGWILRLPDARVAAGQAAIAPAELIGTWERPVDSRYGVGNPRAHSVGAETLKIAAKGESEPLLSYTKIHLYREQVGREVLTRAYREFGAIDARGAYLLFRPARGEVFGPDSSQAPPDAQATAIDVPAVHSLTWAPVAAPAPLLYYYEAERAEPAPHYREDRKIAARLTPLAYEAFGEIYEYGIFEGTRDPYDYDSTNFRDALKIWNGKRNQPHAYIRQDP